MKKLISFTLLVMLLVMASCSNSPDKERLLRCVPESSYAVMAMNVESLFKDAGNKITSNGVEFSPGFSKFVKQIDNDQGLLPLLSDGAIEPSWFLLYEYKGYMFCAGIVADESKFKEQLSKTVGADFKSNDGVETCGNIALRDGVFVFTESSRCLDDAVAMLKQKESESLLDSAMADIIKDKDDDVFGVVNIDRIPNTGSFAYVKMAMSMAMKDAKFIAFDIDFEKGKLEFDIDVLNSKGVDADLNSSFKFEKINMNVVNSLKADLPMVLAVGVDQSTVTNIVNMLMPMMPGNTADKIVLGQLKKIDGTIAIAMDPFTSQYIASVEMKDAESASDLAAFVSSMAGVSQDAVAESNGRILTIGNYSTDEPVALSKYVRKFDDCMLACAVDINKKKENNSAGELASLPFTDFLLEVKVERNHLDIEGTFYLNDDSRNALQVLLGV